MRCCNCGVDIPPEWKGALSVNQCPSCLKQIYNDATKQLMEELADAMAKMPNDPQGIAGWLLSNYRFQKIGDGKPVDKFFGGSTQTNSPNQSGSSEVSKFAKNGEAEKYIAKSAELAAKKGGKMAEMASMIQNLPDMYEDAALQDSPTQELSPEDQREYAALKASGIDPFMPENAILASGEVNIDGIVSGMAKESAASYETMMLGSDEGRRILEDQLRKKVKTQGQFSSGGGSFRR